MDRREQPASRWRYIRFVGGSYRIPLPPGPPPEPRKAEREEEARLRAHGQARIARLHLVGLMSGGVIVMALALVVVFILFMLVVFGHR
jgi:hypothetical protein